MKITITITLDDAARIAIARQTGEAVPADRAQCKAWIEKTIRADIESIRGDSE